MAVAAQGFPAVRDGAEPVLRLARQRIMDANRLRPGDRRARRRAARPRRRRSSSTVSRSRRPRPANRAASTPPRRSRDASDISPSTGSACRSNAGSAPSPLLADRPKSFQQMVIFRNQWDGKRVVRKGELIAWRAEFDWTAEEALELRQPRVARQSKGHLSRLKLSAGHFAQSFDRGGNYKFGVPPGEVPRKANKCGLDDHIFERPVYLQTLNFIADAATASGQRQRVAAIQDRDGATLGLTASASASIGSNSSGPMAAVVSK